MLNRLKRVIGHRNVLRLLWHRTKGWTAALLCGFPASKLYVIGITGTDGKTTTVGMTAHILRANGIQTGALSTASMQIGEEGTWNATQKTSPSPFVVQKFLSRCRKAGCTHVVLECSSHGLVQGRLASIVLDVAAITNISEEHLDYHGTMQQYRNDKALLFAMLHGRGTKVLNKDDSTYKEYSRIQSKNTISYSAHSNNATLTLSDIQLTPKYSTAWVHYEEENASAKLTVPLPGSFNLENALCAISCVQGFISVSSACNALSTFGGVPGRMEAIDEGQPFSVFVDFTVTPAAYEKTLSTLRQMLAPGKRVLVLTGSCGDRMQEKRPKVGKICSQLADVVVVTNEDPYTEDPQKIIDEVWAGVDQTACQATQIFDRREAIRYLFDEAREGDIVILCAKGSDTTMWVKDGQIPWNEREIARELLRTQKTSPAHNVRGK
ncbi:MAG: UDP-N-acetylmuramoyl-L-alanyl-D-glutamate--2,6-diaminopimelate ligase [Candidatus Peregrinibacteria bacterium]|nr:UDP-N-acetylmuramoyl-L-alanyl-D-glutamate--2,6-diaminopimelate ligase [Candidatus Peregrinibacteria bacterium]MCB9808541.1 UDP-N-acetylmuramoyl-L-alanyl-D-glutamate--2,6-diaminopimelate ligase [Candidatus Peribacteria bacterium]